MKKISPVNLTRENFSKFGDVIEVNDKSQPLCINDGFTKRYHDLAEIDLNKNNGKTLVSIFRSSPVPIPVEIKKMERHPLSSQSFIPMGEQPYLIVVAPKGPLDESKIQVFLASPDQGVNYHAGTWHHFSLALNEESDFLVIDRGGKECNCDEVILQTAITIETKLIVETEQ